MDEVWPEDAACKHANTGGKHMRERINRLARGIIDTEVPEITIQPESLERVAVDAGGLEKKELYITSQNGLHIKGLAYSSNPRVRVLTASFGGLRNHVMYEIDSEYLEHGDMIEGEFVLVTNGGEFTLPYSFTAQSGVYRRFFSKITRKTNILNKLFFF